MTGSDLLIERIWAKSGNPSHSLLGHMLDTAAVALEVLAREPESTLQRLAPALGMHEEETARFLAFVAGAHDLGKATPGFQQRWGPGARALSEAGFPFPAMALVPPHGALTEHLLRHWLAGRGLPRSLARDVARAAAAHHGFLPQADDVAQAPVAAGDGPWENARRLLLEALIEALDVRQWPRTHGLEAPVAVALMALTSLADWIASAEDLFPYGRQVRDPRAYLANARDRARHALDAIGWLPRRPLTADVPPFEEVFPGYRPNEVQQQVIEAVRAADGPVLVLLEAPMGSGKTEAALYAHLVLQQRLGHRGLYVALPTMATGNAMFPRVRQYLARFADRPLDLQLQHGSAAVHEAYRNMRIRQVGEDLPADRHQGVMAAEWFTHRKQAMLSEYGVGTVDQALLGVLRVRHHFVRLFGLGNRTVVLDEVHAYDTYTSGLIEALLRWLREQRSSVILMSATLPSGRRQALLQAFGAGGAAEGPGYPRVTVVAGGRTRTVSIPWPHRRRVEVHPAPRDVDALSRLSRATADEGGCLLCVVNTVERAQRLYAALGTGEPIAEDGTLVGKRCGDVDVYLLHARFPAEEREVREGVVLGRFGKEGCRRGSRPARAIVVATQVMEQSMDVDFDVLVSDLAPVDLLLQRVGRLHRFTEAPRPPAHQVPRCYVAGGPPEGPELGEWRHVYSPYVLFRTWCELRERRFLEIPGDLQTVVDRVYGDEPLDLPPELAERVRTYRVEHAREQARLQAWVRGNALGDVRDLLEPGAQALELLRMEDDEDADSQVPLTRVGEPSLAVVPFYRIGGALFLDPDGRQRVDPEHIPDEGEALRIARRSVRLGGWRVYRALRDLEIPAGWQQHPLLRRLRPLELVEGVASLGGVRVRWDPELGMVYE